MNRKDISVGTRVIPSGRGRTKHWNLQLEGTVTELYNPIYVNVEWDWREAELMRPAELEPLRPAPIGQENENG